MRLPLGYIPGVGLVTSSTLNSFGRKILERLGWRNRETGERGEDDVTEAAERKDGEGTSRAGELLQGAPKTDQYRRRAEEDTQELGDDAVRMDVVDATGTFGESAFGAAGLRQQERSFQTTQGRLKEDGIRTKATTEELKIHTELAVGGGGDTGERKSKIVRTRQQENFCMSTEAVELSSETKRDENHPEPYFKVDSIMVDGESNGTPLEEDASPFGSPVADDEAGGFGSTIHVPSSGCLSSDAVEPKTDSKETEGRKKNANWQVQAEEDQEGGPLGVTADNQNDGSGRQSVLPVKRSTRKRKRKMYLGEEEPNEVEKLFVKDRGPKPLKSGISKKQRPTVKSRPSQHWKRVPVVIEGMLGEPDLENVGQRNAGKRSVSKRKGPRKGSQAPQRRRLKFDKKAKSDTAMNKHKRAAGDAPLIVKRRRGL